MDRLKAWKVHLGSEDAFTALINSPPDEALEGELEAHIADEESEEWQLKNDHSHKVVIC